ncbi:MAG: hypothetical protein AABN33_01530 [Acidobacteriota bacterium]
MVRSLPWLAVIFSSALYFAHLFFGGGSSHLILDSFAYLQLSDGQQTDVPFNTRIVTPLLAKLVAYASGLSTSAAFKLLTPAELLASLFVLRGIICKRGGSAAWQAAVLLAFGCSLAVTFGYTPILVDPTFLLLICLTIAALDAGHLLAALALACIAALTKEFGLFLVPIWSFYAYRQGLRKFAYAGLIVPVAALLIVLFARQSSAGVGFPGWPTYASHLMFEYQLSVFRLRGPGGYAKLLYMGSWCGLWPVLFISTYSLLYRCRRRIKITEDQVGLAVLLISLPVLLLGDWSRNLIILVPFACIVATAHPLTRNRSFILLLAAGGLSTALARPFHSENPPPRSLSLIMTIISVVSSLLIAARIFRFATSKSGPQLDSRLDSPAPEVVPR